MVVGDTCPSTALLICFNLIVCQLDESINRLSLICKWCIFVKQGVESGSPGFKFRAAWPMWPLEMLKVLFYATGVAKQENTLVGNLGRGRDNRGRKPICVKR